MKILAPERRWLDYTKTAVGINRAKPLLTICGPSGVGKTTISRELSDASQVYLESVSKNPYQCTYLQGIAFDAAANQRWFLETMFEFLQRCDPKKSLVLDQDPAAIVLIYSRLFLDNGLLSAKAYSEHIDILMLIEKRLLRWRVPRVIVFLDAKSEVLRQRVMVRSNSPQIPPLIWFQRLRRRFRDFRQLVPQAPIYLTHKTPMRHIVLHMRQICTT